MDIAYVRLLRSLSQSHNGDRLEALGLTLVKTYAGISEPYSIVLNACRFALAPVLGSYRLNRISVQGDLSFSMTVIGQYLRLQRREKC